jgi:type IV secretion system protein VirD4
MNAPASARRPEAPDVLVWGLLVLITVVPGIIWLAAQAAALVTGHLGAGIGFGDAARAVPRLAADPGEPAAALDSDAVPGPVVYWATMTALVAGSFVVAVRVGVAVARRRARPGMAARRDLQELSARAVAARASVLRPDLGDTAGRDDQLAAAGVSLGRHHPTGVRLWGTIEDSYLVIAPPRTGKTVRVVIPTVMDHHGPAVVTSTRREAVDATLTARLHQGPVWVFDADLASRTALPAGARPARWSPVSGARDPQAAMMRARSLARAAGAGVGVTNGEFWATHAQTVMQCYLHAAALAERSIGDVRRWAFEPDNREAVTILRTSPTAPAWAGELGALARVADRQRDGVWGVAQQSLAALAEPRLLERCNPAPGEGFDPDELLGAGGTLYVVGRTETQDVVAPLVAALVEAVVEADRRCASEQPGGRLAPPLLVALDEAANIAPLPGLPTLVADGGGSGITTVVVLQSRAQAREKWGENAADAIVAACTHRLILGGGGELRELEDLARLVGERDEEVRSQTWQPWGAGQGRSTSTALRRVPIITPADLQALPKGRGVLCSPSTRPAEVSLTAWWERPDASAGQETLGPDPDPGSAVAEPDAPDEDDSTRRTDHGH